MRKYIYQIYCFLVSGVDEQYFLHLLEEEELDQLFKGEEWAFRKKFKVNHEEFKKVYKAPSVTVPSVVSHAQTEDQLARKIFLIIKLY